MAKIRIRDFVEDKISGFLEENGYELYHVDFVKEAKDRFLRIYIDNANHSKGISTDDCEAVSRYLSEILDKEDPIEQNYYLEVSSPGMDRQLYTDKHLERYIGQRVEVALYKKIDNKKKFEATLTGFDDKTVTVKEESEMVLDRESISKINLAVIF